MSFAQIRLWAVILGTIALTGAEACLVLVLWRGGWPLSLAARQLDFVGWIAVGTLGLIAMGLAAITMISVRATGPAGLSIGIGRDDPPEPSDASAVGGATP